MMLIAYFFANNLFNFLFPLLSKMRCWGRKSQLLTWIGIALATNNGYLNVTWYKSWIVNLARATLIFWIVYKWVNTAIRYSLLILLRWSLHRNFIILFTVRRSCLNVWNFFKDRCHQRLNMAFIDINSSFRWLSCFSYIFIKDFSIYLCIARSRNSLALKIVNSSKIANWMGSLHWFGFPWKTVPLTATLATEKVLRIF